MKKLTIALVLAAALCLGSTFRQAPKQNQITPERKATHMITYYSAEDQDKPVGLCTGTVVGPHALLTALHCDRGETDLISLDLSVQKFHVIGIIYDGRDHIIYHLDGPVFKNIVTIQEREAVLGETVTSYGDGRGDFPQHTYFGKAIVDANGGDTSELDAADGTHCFSLPVVPGDSGSAIYGTDGSIVALVTYGDDKNAVGFALAFSPEELDKIKN
jgi:V8-like Glu-specific endopeptidase